jgi:hypothetical protein
MNIMDSTSLHLILATRVMLSALLCSTECRKFASLSDFFTYVEIFNFASLNVFTTHADIARARCHKTKGVGRMQQVEKKILDVIRFERQRRYQSEDSAVLETSSKQLPYYKLSVSVSSATLGAVVPQALNLVRGFVRECFQGKHSCRKCIPDNAICHLSCWGQRQVYCRNQAPWRDKVPIHLVLIVAKWSSVLNSYVFGSARMTVDVALTSE